MNKLAVMSFVGSGIAFGGATYKFVTDGVSLFPLMTIGIGACLLSLGFIKVLTKEKK